MSLSVRTAGNETSLGRVGKRRKEDENVRQEASVLVLKVGHGESEFWVEEGKERKEERSVGSVRRKDRAAILFYWREFEADLEVWKKESDT